MLLLHRHLERTDVLTGIRAALSVASTSVDVVALEARKAAEQRGAQTPDVAELCRQQRVVNLTERRLAALPSDDRPLPSVEPYDQLLRRNSS